MWVSSEKFFHFFESTFQPVIHRIPADSQTLSDFALLQSVIIVEKKHFTLFFSQAFQHFPAGFLANKETIDAFASDFADKIKKSELLLFDYDTLNEKLPHAMSLD